MSFDFTGLFKIYRVRGAQMSGLCPFHSDRAPSFSANSESGLWQCFAGCGSGNYEQFLEKLRGEGLGTSPTGVYEAVKSWSAIGEPMIREAYYIYLSEDGKEHLRVNRFRTSNGSKSFSQEYKDIAGGWQSGGTKKKLLPYRIQNWCASPYVVIVEGEKCVDALYGIGICATTFCGGSSGWRDHYANLFLGKRVVLLPDNDDPGRRFTGAVEGGLRARGVSTKNVSLTGLGDGDDVIDWIHAGNSVQALKEIIEI
jgi:putative DNA primase/helicase